MSSAPDVFEFHSSSVKLLAFSPCTLDIDALRDALAQRLGEDHMLAGEDVVLDFDSLPQTPDATQLAALRALLGEFGVGVAGVSGGNDAQQQAAANAGLLVLADTSKQPPARAVNERVPAMVVTRPVRTGQQVYARGGDLVVLALVSNGAEVIADGSIHVYAPLRGRALAGARGETSARIYSTCMEAELVSIGGVYRTLDDNVPASIKSKAAQVYFADDKLVIEALNG
ncbi:septum site-determining protein MinC [Chitinibacteraceae bacterium HSL-7]